ncbi:IS66-like element accessory protein TnpA [Phaeovulum sp.]|uniref:IS66-like element accessory protein TnpA n=1 Tax=Phaeovulum sp. TaxID=2934796 RepID=UPI0027312AB8|nr:transposase [Phaeovulum sp.]MDP1667440.1 transposase [Phaeovulum sp.]MDZ4119957.1 transposase [Phaeovulum sp.]
MHSDVVNDVSYAGLAMRGDILGLERRRRWGEEEKLGIVLSVGVEGASVTQVAQRHDVTRQQIYAWRHGLKKKGVLSALPEALFLPVELDRRPELAVPVPVPVTDAEARRPARIELQLANGRCLRFDPGLEASTLTQLIRAVEGA